MTEIIAAPNATHPNGDVDHDMENDTKTNLRFSTGLILPPPEIKCELLSVQCPQFIDMYVLAVIDKTADFVASSEKPERIEDKIREGQRSDPKFSFLNPVDPYHAYYKHKLAKAASGEKEEGTPRAAPTAEVEVVKEPVDIGVEPPTPHFILELPNVSPVDLCVAPPYPAPITF